MAETSTIRVTRDTRDLLADQARERGISLAALLADVAQRNKRDAIFRAERDAERLDADVAGVLAEEREWEAVTADGVE